MTDLRQAAQQALKALDTLKIALRVGMPEYGAEDQDELLETAITALRAALAQPEEWHICPTCGGMASDPIAAPPQRKPLSEEEIYRAVKGVDSLRAVEVARAIERAHGIGGSDE